MLPKSIRRQLPLTYGAIALLATLSLGVVLLAVLRSYYSEREFAHLQSNAMAISQILATNPEAEIQLATLRPQLLGLSFLTQSRVQLLNPQHELVADSGTFTDQQMITFGYKASRPVQPPGMADANASAEIIDPPPDLMPFEAAQSTEPVPWVSGASGHDTTFFISANDGSATINRQILQRNGDLMVMVAGTPYGFGLNIDVTLGQRSDQRVEIPLTNGGKQFIGYIALSEGPAYGMEILNGVAKALLGAGLVAVVVAAGVGWFISHRITGPLDVLTQTTNQMANGDLSARVDLNQADEFGLLAKTFNEMAHQVEHTVTTLKRFVSDAAHELQTPLTAVYANLELALSEPDEGQRTSFLEQARTQLRRLEVLTNNLLDLSRIEAGQAMPERMQVNLKEMIQSVSELYASRAEQKGIGFEFNFSAEVVHLHVNEPQLQRVLANLLDNAIKFTPENGLIEVGFVRQESRVKLWVQDTGIGIPQEDLAYLFNRFKRGRNVAAYPGSGLGLAITKAIVEGHQGSVNVESSEKGTRFWVQLPAMV